MQLASRDSCRDHLSVLIYFAAAGSSVGDHLLGSYTAAAVAVVQAQFTARRFPNGMQVMIHCALMEFVYFFRRAWDFIFQVELKPLFEFVLHERSWGNIKEGKLSSEYSRKPKP